MGLAQRLYEGVEVGDDGLVGLITYMRTDSTRISDDAVAEARGYIGERYGASFLPAEPVVYKSKKGAQDAHEAIRPTSLKYDPETVRAAWAGGKGGGRDERESEDLLKLYTLIWNRFVACQMVPAVFDQTTIDIDAGRVELRASGQVMKFPGFLEVYAETVEDARQRGRDRRRAARVHEGEAIRLLETKPEQHFTQPPPRFSEATLVKELEEKGIGRPSTYAAILSTIQDRGYVEKKEGRLHPTELGVMVNGLLVKSFPDIVSTDFTAQMEEQLDQVEDGTADWVKLLDGFYEPFKLDLEKAKVEMRDIKREEQATDEVCEKCGKPMVIKWGRNGHFLACSGYPDCRNTKEYTQNADGSLTIVSTTRPSDQICPTCGSPMVIRRGRFGEFLACSRYPECKTTSPLSLGVACPKEGCGGYLTEKRSQARQGLLRLLELLEDPVRLRLLGSPAAAAVPEVRRQVRRPEGLQGAGTRIRCLKEDCGYTADAESPEARGPAPAPTGTGYAPPTCLSAASERQPGPPATVGVSRTSVATDSTWRVCGNMSNGCSRGSGSRRRAAPRCRAPASRGCTRRRRSCAARRRRAGARKSGPQPLRGGSTMTARSAAGKGTAAKTALASAARNAQLARPLRAALARAQRTALGLTSTPRTRSNPGAAASASRPLPQ